MAGHRPAEVVALHAGAPKRAQDVELAHCLDALTDGVEVKGLRHSDDGGDDRPIVGVGLETLDERAVDLQFVDGEAAQSRERGKAGTEIVDRQ